MNGNRGAKGSVKDRLISLLYRLRYSKKMLKEESSCLKAIQLFDDEDSKEIITETIKYDNIKIFK